MIRCHIPMPLQVVIDDVGWWSGVDGHERQEPYRSGIGRPHVPADYAAIVSLGRQPGMRPIAAMVLCEWDRANLLREIPSATWMGAGWDNRRWVGPWLDEAADLLQRGRDHVEIALHGVGHEYWEGPAFSRAEWHGRDGLRRPRNAWIEHLDAYARILSQNNLGDFPETFVPAAFLHVIGDGPEGLAALLATRGIRRIATPNAVVREGHGFPHPLFAVDAGTLTVLQPRAYRYPWYEVASHPVHPVEGPLLGLHWPNLLDADPDRNAEAVARWVDFLRPYERRPDRVLAPNSAACWTQLAHCGLTTVTTEADRVILDTSAVRRLGVGGLLDTVVVRLLGDQVPRLSWEGAVPVAERAVTPGCGELTLRLEPGSRVVVGQV